MRILNQFLTNEEGSTAVTLAVMFPLFIGATILATEVGYWRMHSSELQNTADMSAIAAAYEYIINNDTRDAGIAAYADALDNEYSPQLGSLVVNIPPSSGAYTSDDAVEVIITQQIPSIISNAFLDNPIEKTVTAVVRLGGQTSESCVLSLGTTNTGISVFGNVDVNLTGCGLHANSSSANAITANGSVTISAGCMSAVGGISTGTATVNLDDCASPRENQPEIDDPYETVDVPANMNSIPCSYASISGNGQNATLSIPSPSSATQPVRLCDSKIDLFGVTTLPPGTYILDGTELNFGSHAELHGTGVTLIFTDNAELSGLNGNNTLDLSAPTSGDYAGVTMYADRNTMTSAEWNFSGNADISLDGLIYLPTLNIRYSGGAGTNATACTRLVANHVTFTGNSGLESRCEAYDSLVPIKGGAYTTVALVE